MRLVIEGRAGRIFHAEAQPDFLRIRPLYCFVPTGIKRSEYANSRWPAINSAANPNAIGSHLFPNWKRPVHSSESPTFKQFLENLPKFIAKAPSE